MIYECENESPDCVISIEPVDGLLPESWSEIAPDPTDGSPRYYCDVCLEWMNTIPKDIR